MIKDGQYYSYGGYTGFTVIEAKCPKCGSSLYMHDGGDQGGIPHIECTNDECIYQEY